MKKILTILIFLISTIALNATTYYISPMGSNSNNGSAGAPWLTLAYATAHTVSGDIIHVNAGTYSISSQVSLPVGISIEGAGATSILSCTVGDFAILLNSGSPNTNGNQHITGIKMDGNSLTGYAAIEVYNRGNVEIANCTFINFGTYGVDFTGDSGGGTNPPATWNTGNKFHDNIVTNCAAYSPHGDKYNGEGKGELMLGNQATLLIYNNNLDQTSRAAGYNGWPIKAVNGFLKDVKIYNNIITKAPYDNLTWDFAIEMWNLMGGIEIYGNTITGSIDFSGWYGVIKGSYAYGAYIHDNTIGISSGNLTGIYFEIYSSDVVVERNTISNVGSGIAWNFYTSDLGPPNKALNTIIRYNVFKIVGTQVLPGGYPEGYGIVFSSSLYTNVVDNFNVYNNVFYGTTGTAATYDGIEIPDWGIATNVRILNNIVQGFANTSLIARANGTSTIDYLWIQNNILYGNGYNTPYLPINPTHYTTSGELATQPPFVSSSDYHLTAARPGIYVTSGLTDRDGVAVANPPTIGAYEYLTGPTIPTVTTTAITNITATTATGGGNVTNNGGGTVTVRGVCWNTSANPTAANSKTTDGSGTGVYVSSIAGLTGNTTYHVRAYATNSTGTGYGADIQFTAAAPIVPPTVTTTTPSSVTQTTASSGGNVASDGGASVTSRGVCWSTTASPTTANSKTLDGTGTGVFTSSIAGLTASTTYHVRAYAVNSAGTAYGSDVQFTTTAIIVVPNIYTTAVTNITATNAQSGGTVVSDGGATITSGGICWATTANPTIANSHTIDYYGSSPYISYFNNALTSATTYYVRAYATNSAGTGYGNQLSFTTLTTTTYILKSGVYVITIVDNGVTKTITITQ